MNIKTLAFYSIMAVAATSASAQITNQLWTGSQSTLWGVAGNWESGNIPDSNTEAAYFRNDEGSAIVTLDGNYTLNQIVFQRTTTVTVGRTINGSANTITLDKNNTTAWYNVLSWAGNVTHTINSNITVANSAGGNSYSNLLAGQSGTPSNLKINGTLTAQTYTNFGGYAGSSLELTGNIVNTQGIRFGQTGVVTISGAGVASGSGVLTFASGTANLNRTSSISAGGNISVSGAATVNFNADNAIASTNNLSLSDTARFSFADADQAFGTLALTGADKVLTISLTGDSDITFASSSALNWVGLLDITMSDTSSVRFGTNASGLTAAQLGRITLNGGIASLDASGYLVVPEPGSLALIALGLSGLVLWRRRR